MTEQSQALREQIQKVLQSQPGPTVTVLSSLLTLQDALGYLPPEAIEETSEFMHVTVNDVWAVASFYTNFRFSPPGEHTVEVCWGPSCHLTGAVPVLQKALETLGMQGEGDSADGKVSLRYNTCLGACAQAPVVSIDHKMAGRMSPERMEKLLRALNGKRGH